jgi:hypothetical protein
MCSGRGRRLWVLSHRVMVPSGLGMFLCAFPFGHVRPLDAVFAEVRGRASSLGAALHPGAACAAGFLSSGPVWSGQSFENPNLTHPTCVALLQCFLPPSTSYDASPSVTL